MQDQSDCLNDDITHAHISHDDIQPMLAEVEALMSDFRKLLVKSDDALSATGIKSEVEQIERWVESYRRGLSAANKIATYGAEILESLKSRLKLASDEILRLEGEGGNTEVTKKQEAQVQELTKAYERFEKLMNQTQEMFSVCNVNQPEKTSPHA